MAESLPTSVSGFHHLRRRADSTTSFSFYYEDQEQEDELAKGHRRVGSHEVDELPFDDEIEEEEDSTDLDRLTPDNDYVLHRRASTLSRGSVHSRLLRQDSAVSAGSSHGAGRTSQKIHMTNEDLYIAIAGFRTSALGFAVYAFVCIVTFGLGWLLFRWIPKWYVKLTGRQVPLRDCQWVVLENQWNEMSILTVDSKPYGRVLSTVFGAPSKMTSYFGDEDPDPILRDLRTLDYRYVRFYFHPLKDKFQLCNGWKDPLWSDVRAIRAGIDQEEKSHRDVVFGNNLIDIEQKSIFRLLVDEVSGELPGLTYHVCAS